MRTVAEGCACPVMPCPRSSRVWFHTTPPTRKVWFAVWLSWFTESLAKNLHATREPGSRPMRETFSEKFLVPGNENQEVFSHSPLVLMAKRYWLRLLSSCHVALNCTLSNWYTLWFW